MHLRAVGQDDATFAWDVDLLAEWQFQLVLQNHWELVLNPAQSFVVARHSSRYPEPSFDQRP